MFGIFKRKSKLEKLIDKEGIELVSKRFSEVILEMMPAEDIVYQFILEEIEAASQGNDTAKNFAKNSGISPSEYKGAMSNSCPEVDGPGGPQQFILTLCMQLQPNVDLVVGLRTRIVDNIMKCSLLGKYGKEQTFPSSDSSLKLHENSKSGFPTISLINRLISVGAERDFIRAVSAIWYIQASNDPNTPESQEIAGAIVGTLENFFVEEARILDAELFKLYTDIINRNEYGALFEDAQPIFDSGRNVIKERFQLSNELIEDLYSFYANMMLKTTKQNKNNLLLTLQELAKYVDEMCSLANKAENDLF